MPWGGGVSEPLLPGKARPALNGRFAWTHPTSYPFQTNSWMAMPGGTAHRNSMAVMVSADWVAALRGYLLATTVLDLLWEVAQLPLYTIWAVGTPREKAFAVLHCTMGDVLIALVSLAAALVIAGDRAWPGGRRYMAVAALTLAIGLAYTGYSEHLNAEVRQSWTYADLMPRLPVLGTGLSPVLQWLMVPTAALFWARRSAVDSAERMPRRER